MSALCPDSDLVFEPVPAADPRAAAQTGIPHVILPARWSLESAERLVATARALPPKVTVTDLGGGGLPFLWAGARETGHCVIQVDEHLRQILPIAWHRAALEPVGRDQLGDSVLITGGLGGLGLRVAEHLVGMGLRVALTDTRRPDQIPAQRIQQAGLVARQGDVRLVSADEVGSLAHAWGGIDHLVACAGTLMLAPAEDFEAPELDQYAVHKSAPFTRMVHLLAPLGLRSVVAFGSAESRKPHSHFGAYALANEQLRLEAGRLREDVLAHIVVAEWSLWSTIGMAAHHAHLAERVSGYATVDPEWGAEATAALLAPRTRPFAEVALGGRAAHPSAPLRAVFGIGGATLHCDRANVERLARLCAPDGVKIERLEVWRPSGGMVHAAAMEHGVTLICGDRGEPAPVGGAATHGLVAD